MLKEAFARGSYSCSAVAKLAPFSSLQSSDWMTSPKVSLKPFIERIQITDRNEK